MQAPQILGIVIGFCFMCAGWFLRRLLLLKGKRVAGGLVFAILAYMGVLAVLQNAIFSYPPSWTWSGVFLVWATFLGTAFVPIAFAFLGLAYRPNKVVGYVVTLIAFTGLMMLGSAK